MKKITIYDVAKALKVAPSTISKALNNTGSVSKETRKKILQYVKETGYVTATNARILKAKHSWMIGAIFSEELNIGLEHPFFSSVLQHFKAYIENAGYELSFIVQRLGQHRMSYLDWCRNKKVDGVIIVSGDTNDQGLIELVESDIKCVSTDMVKNNLYSIRSDNYEGIEMALDYLLKLGYRKIATIPGPVSSFSFYERLMAFNDYMRRKHVPVKSEYIVQSEGFGFTSGYNAARKMLSQTAEPPAAIIAGSDDISFGVIRGIESMGFRVPDDISVIGFDDISTSRLFTPALTTIRQNKKIIGETAGKILIDLIHNRGNDYPKKTLIPVDLVIRSSVKIK